MNDELIKTIGLFRSIDKMNSQEYLDDISTIECFCAAQIQLKKICCATMIRILLCGTDLWLCDTLITLIDEHNKRNHCRPNVYFAF